MIGTLIIDFDAVGVGLRLFRDTRLEGTFDDISVHVRLIGEDIKVINGNIEDGQFFFSDIRREGKIL